MRDCATQQCNPNPQSRRNATLSLQPYDDVDTKNKSPRSSSPTVTGEGGRTYERH
ncbi:hypothetical protein JMJ77_0007161 [Colletotrichum scovillei]|uniref:Uncharacterized protein n=1 Tax=Colletotrichum scovillei TaxID=1209932 RepID=A0A9P7UL02_9PEZI|nr:hypothetical protein JMJ77_0007161 [Colletotrichum scovillei]KAG7074127.1 hypothetical protein JMJ76_0010614 [Colletotrichum scovillei]KAG7081504.1 hypothetical protein JMJ78_0003623 [Colletotrichum scovillei]